VVGYSIEAVGPGGTSRQQQNINVVDPATATPAPTAQPDQPVIYTFSVNPKQIEDGACLDLNWSVGGGASYARILRNGDVVLDNVPLTGHSPDCPSPAGTYTYRLEAFNAAGNQVNQQQQAQVADSTPQNPLANTQWRATQVAGSPVLEGTTITAGFGADLNVSGSSGCNTYSGSYYVDGSSLTIGPLTATGALCEQEIMDQETAYLAALGSATGFSMEAGQLYILDGSGSAVIEYVAVEP
jgi:heat shock protein HslJ